MMKGMSFPIGANNLNQLLFIGRALDFQSTSDQALTKVFSGTKFLVTNVVAQRTSGGASITCAGGLYSTTAKGGSAIVAAAQSWVTLSSTVNVLATVAAITAILNSAIIYLSLSTGSTAACTGDVYVYGYCLD